MSWRDNPIIGFDTETSGVNPETARIVTACIGTASAEHGWQPITWLIKQVELIPAEAIAIHGVTTEHANEHGVDPVEALGQIRASLYQAWAHGWPVAGHNIVYDFTILDRELLRWGFGALEIRGPVIDTLVVDKAVDRFRKGKRTLSAAAAHYGIPLPDDEAHGAEPDALAAVRLAWKLAGAPMPRDLYPGEVADVLHGGKPPDGRSRLLADAGLTDIHLWQVAQYAEQRESFAQYLARKGETLDDPSTDWPIRKVAA